MTTEATTNGTTPSPSTAAAPEAASTTTPTKMSDMDFFMAIIPVVAQLIENSAERDFKREQMAAEADRYDRRAQREDAEMEERRRESRRSQKVSRGAHEDDILVSIINNYRADNARLLDVILGLTTALLDVILGLTTAPPDSPTDAPAPTT